MKKHIFEVLFLGLLWAITSTSALSQGRYNVRAIPLSINCATNKVLACVEIQATSTDSAFVMGTANLRIGFKPAQLLGTPVITTRDNFTSGDYNNITSVVAVGTDTSFFTLNINYRGENGNGTIVGMNWTRVACVEFTINTANTTKCYDLFLSKSSPSTVVRRAVASPTIDEPGRTLTVLASQGTFTHITNQCPTDKAVVSLTGDATINSGQSTPLNISLVSGTFPFTVMLTGGITLNVTGSTTTTNVSPLVTTVYEITSVSNQCGSGVADANARRATITVRIAEDCPPQKCIKVLTKLIK
ncbi:MAG: hypothetical protein EAZ70_01820 [Runella slithyformis]|nr:MAG: hypothetical protein EAZ80_09015 [Runella slithyformis]TAF29450.1 MAG: hypothetical protein EAZ70_01820 [Runella slithyformis]TAF48199.1 MAG: hypothetical protein EAZ63_05890 [Runella slithyformis]TAH16160.1 MAG: hypothetical protein EAZ14_00990 [Runella slithyformis]